MLQTCDRISVLMFHGMVRGLEISNFIFPERLILEPSCPLAINANSLTTIRRDAQTGRKNNDENPRNIGPPNPSPRNRPSLRILDEVRGKNG